MERIWAKPGMSEISFNTDTFKTEGKMSDSELKIKLKKNGYKFSKKFQSKSYYIHRRIAGNDVLISVGENIANFNGYIELNASAAFLWDEMKEPRTSEELEESLEEHFNLPHEKAVEDVLDFLKELQENNMVTVS